MTADPVAKFFSLSGGAAAALAGLERVGKKRCALQGELEQLRRRAREYRVDRQITDRIAALEEEVRYLLTRETSLLGEYEAAAKFEDRMRGELQRRKML